MFVLIIIIAIILALCKTPIVKGKIGELIIGLILGKNSEEAGKEKYVINDLILQLEDGKTSQIDHILINKNGVHVIETKNYAGRIYGGDYQKEWTQVLNYGRVKNHFYNPVRQNHTHTCAVEKLLPEGTPIHSLIVFVRGNIAYIKSDYVCSPWNINERINTNSGRTLSLKEMQSIYDALLSNNKRDTISNREHVDNIKQAQDDFNENINNRVCPKCKGNLIIKKGRYGEFLACSHYPDCKFTKKVEK